MLTPRARPVSYLTKCSLPQIISFSHRLSIILQKEKSCIHYNRPDCLGKYFWLTGTVLNKSNGSLLCFAQLMERETARKNRKNMGGKWQCPLVIQIKRSHIVYKTMSITVGLEK